MSSNTPDCKPHLSGDQRSPLRPEVSPELEPLPPRTYLYQVVVIGQRLNANRRPRKAGLSPFTRNFLLNDQPILLKRGDFTVGGVSGVSNERNTKDSDLKKGKRQNISRAVHPENSRHAQ